MLPSIQQGHICIYALLYVILKQQAMITCQRHFVHWVPQYTGLPKVYHCSHFPFCKVSFISLITLWLSKPIKYKKTSPANVKVNPGSVTCILTKFAVSMLSNSEITEFWGRPWYICSGTSDHIPKCSATFHYINTIASQRQWLMLQSMKHCITCLYNYKHLWGPLLLCLACYEI